MDASILNEQSLKNLFIADLKSTENSSIVYNRYPVTISLNTNIGLIKGEVNPMT